VTGKAELETVTTDLVKAVGGADVIMVVTPATAHRQLARALASLVDPDQVLVLNPGRTGGALEVVEEMTVYGSTPPIVAEAQTMLFASRALGGGVCHIYGVKRFVPLAAFPAEDTPKALAPLIGVFPQYYAAKSVLETSLDNMGAIFHPGVTLLNAAHIEATGGSFDYYMDGITPSVAKVISLMDGERVGVAEAYGVRARSAREWLAEAYGAEGETLLDAVRSNDGYAGIKAPSHLYHRYVWEDVPTGLVPISELGRLAGVVTPTIDAMISLASALHGTDYRSEGRNSDRMGLSGLAPGEISELTEKGGLPFEHNYRTAGPALGNVSG
jgi:opine dehydrogenase